MEIVLDQTSILIVIGILVQIVSAVGFYWRLKMHSAKNRTLIEALNDRMEAVEHWEEKHDERIRDLEKGLRHGQAT